MAMTKAEHDRKYYLANREKRIADAAVRQKKYTRRNMEYIFNLKKTTPCADCKQFYHPFCMDFDHIGDDKVENVGKLVRRGHSLETLKREIAKCEIVCSNCHRLRTAERFGSEWI